MCVIFPHLARLFPYIFKFFSALHVLPTFSCGVCPLDCSSTDVDLFAIFFQLLLPVLHNTHQIRQIYLRLTLLSD